MIAPCSVLNSVNPLGPRTRTDVCRARPGCVSAPEHRDDREEVSEGVTEHHHFSN